MIFITRHNVNSNEPLGFTSRNVMLPRVTFLPDFSLSIVIAGIVQNSMALIRFYFHMGEGKILISYQMYNNLNHAHCVGFFGKNKIYVIITPKNDFGKLENNITVLVNEMKSSLCENIMGSK